MSHNLGKLFDVKENTIRQIIKRKSHWKAEFLKELGMILQSLL